MLPVISGNLYGQIHLIVLVCLLAGIWLVGRKRESLGGVVLGIGVVLKYLPVFVVLYYILRGRWRVAATSALTALTLLGLEALIVTPQRVSEAFGAGESDVYTFASRFQGGDWLRAVPDGAFLRYPFLVIFVAAVVWNRWLHRSETVNDTLGAGWAIVTALLLSPLAWWLYITWLVPAFLGCLAFTLNYIGNYVGASPSTRRYVDFQRWWPCIILVAVYMLFDIPQQSPVGLANYRFMALGVLALWLLCGALYVRSAGIRLPQGVRHSVASVGQR